MVGFMAKGSRVKIEDLGKAISQDLTMYSDDVVERVNEASQKACRSLVDRTRQTAPTLTGVYAGAIAGRLLLKKRSGDETWQWYVRNGEHGLTHLLVKGHRTPKGRMTQKFPYLPDAYDAVLAEYERAVEEAIRK